LTAHPREEWVERTRVAVGGVLQVRERLGVGLPKGRGAGDEVAVFAVVAERRFEPQFGEIPFDLTPRRRPGPDLKERRRVPIAPGQIHGLHPGHDEGSDEEPSPEWNAVEQKRVLGEWRVVLRGSRRNRRRD